MIRSCPDDITETTMDAVNLASFIEPNQHPDCCMTISQSLLKTLAGFLPRLPATVLSIGSGTGLLEALLLELVGESLDIRGVEVSPQVNKYLAEQDMIYVGGTWDLSRQANNADAWVFVYPRDPRLLARYLDLRSHDRLVRIIWLGPRMDWQDYKPIFGASRFSQLTILEDCGAAGYELVAIAEPPALSSKSPGS